MTTTVTPLGQEGRPKCSVLLADADLGLGNANWMKGLQAQSDWTWSGNLLPVPFPNHLARYFLQIPAIFEHQLQFSTTLIFDEPSFRNGVQVSGFIERPLRELVINLIAHRRRAWYTMTHHAVLGTLTAMKHGIAAKAFGDKLVILTEHERFEGAFTALEHKVLKFADAFATDPKRWTDDDCKALKAAFAEDNLRRYEAERLWMDRLEAARAAWRGAMATGRPNEAESLAARAAAGAKTTISDADNERMVNAQLVELAFLCLQFVALAGVFTSLNIPDEEGMADTLQSLLHPDLVARINELNSQGGAGMQPIVPAQLSLPIEEIVGGQVKVEPPLMRGSRVPLVSYEKDTRQATHDKGLAVGGVQVGAWGWSFGLYFPGGLVYLLMHHPELARFEAPYSLPLLFNEDEWRNGTQTGGFVGRRLKEVVYLKIYSTTRARYGLEHHTMFLVNIYRDEYGVGMAPNPELSDNQKEQAAKRAIQHVENVVLYVQEPGRAPKGTYTEVELATIEWVTRVLTRPHEAHLAEPKLRRALDEENRREVRAGTRRLDNSPGIGTDAAHRRLLDHQVAELAMITGHMDGLGRAMTILRLEAEAAVKREDGFMTDRYGLFDVYKGIGITDKIQTANELRLNPQLLDDLKTGKVKSPVKAAVAEKTGEF